MIMDKKDTTTTKPFVPSIWGRLHEPKEKQNRSTSVYMINMRFYIAIQRMTFDSIK